ncbi:hypothetical protein LTR78_010798 [Recurvomyces mirabilis]|uniref:RED-like N-terminal domain-containing protein n=1 Tax=Recurvomyces mirabilis TaxID=574656 RepID=A0AAE0WEX8_9PEZI|nr:hypothetical protein LTR78_010798 [Recurvomyces mirabilis]KAK5149504.1 hypothetical protein LTS14_010870 [Recurvomyces mirabilis]
MNNNQFRKLVLDKPARNDDGSPSASSGATPSSFGGKRSSFMTPRTIQGGGGVDFARQVRERNAALQPTKKFRSSAPKGAKLGKAYTDRARAREEADDVEDDKASRIQALEEQMKLEQISKETFEQLRDQIAGGDVSSTHLVKGLDRRLLERVRRGEDVLGVNGGESAVEPSPDVDEELDKLGEKEVEAVKKEQAEKKGSMAPPSQVAGKKRSRDEIMAELKAQRQATMQAKAGPMLDSRWRKVSEQQKSRIEIDHKGREVLITVDEDGVVKRKVRKMPTQTEAEAEADRIEMPDASKPILGADTAIPASLQVTAPVEDEDDDIFEGAGVEYNPLGDDADGDEEDDDSEADQPQPTTQIRKELSEAAQPHTREEDEASDEEDSDEDVPSTATTAAPARRNYFGDTLNADDKPSDHFAGIRNVLKKAAQLDSTNRGAGEDDERDGESEEAWQARLKRRAQMLANQDRDLEDMDMGFGGSRLEDEVDGDEDSSKKIRLSEWKGGKVGEEDGDDGKAGDSEKREKKKRKPKKRKGDVNNAADIMRVIEGRKGGAK